jgi:hypothetical protein
MPWTKFICPDRVEIDMDKCIEKCRMKEGRCVALPTLIMFKKGRRPWKGLISTTQALNGTRLEFLKIKQDYAEAPCSRAFALLGTFHHLRYQKVDLPGGLSEEWMEDSEGSGMFDYYDAETKTLYDFKTTGAYKVNRWLGRFQQEVETGEFYKTGEKKGQPKTRKEWYLGEPDNFDLTMQLSRYAWMLCDAGFPVEQAYVQATVRDYTAMTARMYALERQIYLISIEILPRDQVVAYYREKQTALLEALEKNELPSVCSTTERWEDKRCAGYCPVWYFCDHGQKVRQETNVEGREG